MSNKMVKSKKTSVKSVELKVIFQVLMEKSGKFLKKLEKMELRDGNYELFKGLL